MRPTSYLGAIIIFLQFVLETLSAGLSLRKQDSEGPWSLPEPIQYSKWAAQGRSTTTMPEQDKVFPIDNNTDLLIRYHEAVRKQKGKAPISPFNTPVFDTATSIPSVIKPSDVQNEASYGTASTVIIVILTIIASSVTIGGNVLVLAAFYLERTLRIPTNYFIASLAVTDVLIGIFSMNLYSLYLLLGYWPLNRILCDLWLGLDYTLCLTSQYTVFFITLDRFFSVKIPAKYRNWRTGNKILIMIAITWILPSSIFFTTILGWPYFGGKDDIRDEKTCYAEFSNNPMFNLILTIAYFWITLTVMTGLYIGIYMVAWRLQKKSEKKRFKVRNYLNLHQNASGKSIASTQNDTEVDFAASSNETGARVTSGEFDSTPVPRKESQKPPQNHNKTSVDRNLGEDLLPYCGPTSPLGGKTIPSNPTCNKTKNGVYTNDCFSDSNSYPAYKDSPKASPTSIAETIFVDIRSPHLSDPEIPESTKVFEKALYSFPSSPAVHIFNDMDNSSEESSLKLSFAYSNPNRSGNSSTGEQPSMFERDQDSDEKFNGFDFELPPSYECQPKRNSTANQMTIPLKERNSGGNTPTSPFPEPNRPKPNMDNRRVSKATAARVAQIWQDRLMMMEEKNHKANHYGKIAPMQNSNSRNSSSGSHATGTSKSKFWGGKKKRFNNYFSRGGNESTTNGASSQAPQERGRTANRARKALKTISIILGAFVLCWTPYHIVILIKGFCDIPKNNFSCVNSYLYTLTYWLCYMNSPINPFCYALANAQFKQVFLRILRFDCKRR